MDFILSFTFNYYSKSIQKLILNYFLRQTYNYFFDSYDSYFFYDFFMILLLFPFSTYSILKKQSFILF